MQQNLRFPAQFTVIPAEELEQVSGGAPAWVGELKDQIRPYWQKAKPILPLASSVARRLLQVIAAGIQHLHLWPDHSGSMHGIKDSLNWFKGLD